VHPQDEEILLKINGASPTLVNLNILLPSELYSTAP